MSHDTMQRIIAGFSLLILLATVTLWGPDAMIMMVYGVQTLVFAEIHALMSFTNTENKKNALDWIFYGIGSAWMLAEALPHHTPCSLGQARFYIVLTYTLWFAMTVYFFEITALRDQLVHFCWLHMAFLLTIGQLYFTAHNLQDGGLEWFIFPALLVVCNDVGAYVCGRLFGQHPLTALSPNKTMEGYIGAAIITLTCGYWVPGIPFFKNITAEEGLALATYASLAAPFSGFFASAIKRSSKIKDFGSLIPGHGGVTDRMDCQLLMPIFTFVFRQWLRKPEFPNLPAAF